MQLKEVKAIVTGGASGLGLAVASRIVRAGGKAVILDLNAPQGNAAAASLGAGATFIAADVSDEAAVDGAVKQAHQAMGSITAAVNCAGIATPGRLVGRQGPMAGSSFRRMIEINLLGTVLVAKAAAVAMQTNAPNAQGERGVIVMTASVAAFDGQIGQIAYSASKGGIVGMTLPMARELASSGIRVMTVAPGLFATPMMKGLPQEAQDSLGKQTPFPPRLGEPDEFAALVVQILENVMLNGETIRLDGAVRMQPR
ncbi:MAG TPA: SDR family NAD(P)-dependent oxidoreductase [Steroidobacteraceae bacterium]|jgi:NAD(P)-dependent dehydrogenase (short-subunit alcohol dehydrogenase family)|nr:SDR family NAD(P)-dependent oxidoreductase [Steroidobacteraceae bacterium]